MALLRKRVCLMSITAAPSIDYPSQKGPADATLDFYCVRFTLPSIPGRFHKQRISSTSDGGEANVSSGHCRKGPASNSCVLCKIGQCVRSEFHKYLIFILAV
ncbi:hypothetical protein J6590_032001 [Homalodisca vitripennis]|nr:hypothetical protein J6590_032001 [Homalodisca vitripennis]